MSTSLQYKLQNVIKHVNQAKKDNNSGNLENTLNNLRKACEAICRAVVITELGDNKGESYINNLTDINDLPITKKQGKKPPLLADLINTLNSKNWITKNEYYRFQDVRYGGNNASHDPLSVNSEVSLQDVNLCIVQFTQILKWFYEVYLRQSVPESLDDFSISMRYTKTDVNPWSDFFNACDKFGPESKYVLVAPPRITDISESQLAILARIKWTMIIDFNSDTKSNGLYKILSDYSGTQLIRPITIEEKDKRERIINTSHHTTNYLMGNGITGLPNTVSSNPREWRSVLKYTQFITRLIKEFLTDKVQKTVYIYLFDDSNYIIDIIRAVDENISNPILAKHVVVYTNPDKLSLLEQQLSDYDVNYQCIPLSSIIAGIAMSVPVVDGALSSKTKQMPARKDGSEIFIDISDKYVSFLSREIEPLYQGIESEEEDVLEEDSFFRGNMIRWKELELDLDVNRSIADSLNNLVLHWLESNKGAYSIDLRHKPGAGGTTLARRIAYNMHRKYPTILIKSYHREKTNRVIFELSETCQMPILAIVEAFQITQNELNALIRKINEDKRHVVILYVIRSFQRNDSSKDSKRTAYLEEKTSDLNERNRFYARYNMLANTQSAKENLKNLVAKSPQECEIIDFALTAYQKDFSSKKLADYISDHLNKIPQSHIHFLGFSSLIYYYTQMDTIDLWFGNLFNDGDLNADYVSRKSDEHYIKKLLINELNEEYEQTNRWRPRYHIFAEEMLMLILGGSDRDNKLNWKDNLSRWSIDLIKCCKHNHSTLTDDLRDMFKSLFLNRDNEDVLGLDENYETTFVSDRKFSNLIRHIANKEQQQKIFETLVECYPNELHFHGHLGRFLYEKANDVSDFGKAYEEINSAIDLGGDTDYNLWHIKGMCNRRKIEFILRSDLSSYDSVELDELGDIIKELTEVASEDYQKSRSLNPFNLHSHTAEIQLLVQVVEFGKKSEDNWFETKVSDILNLIDEAKYIIELSKDLDQSKLIEKSRTMINDCQAKFFQVTGNYSKSIDRFRQLSETADRSMRPYFRRMFVYSTLASKVKNQYSKYSMAWEKLSSHEYDSLKKAIETNIQEEPENTHHIKLWLQAVRFSKKYVSLDDCISTVKLWYDSTEKYEIAHLEATYYLYVLNACKAISEENSVTDYTLNEAKQYLKECRERKVNDKFSFEWFGKGEGIKYLVNHNELGKMNIFSRFFSDTSLLARVDGTIITIDDRQKGKIRLKCGLEAFFVPVNGGFTTDYDELVDVNFFIGFRQDQLMAWEVKRHNSTKKVIPIEPLPSEVVLEDYDDEVKSEENDDQKPVPLIHLDNDATQIESLFDKPVLKQPIVVGKIDLSEFEKFKKKNREM